MSQLLITAPDGSFRELLIGAEPVTLGRGAGNNLSYPEDGGLSRQHLAFEAEGERFTVRDMGSKNGTFVNGERLTGKHYLQSGDRITASRVVIIFGESERAAPQTVIFEAQSTPVLSGGTVRISLQELLAKGGTVHIERPVQPEEGIWSSPVQALVRAGRELVIRRPLNELFRVILDLAMEAVNSQRGILLTLEEGGLVVQASSGGEFRISTAVRDKVLQDRASLLIRDVQDDMLLQQRQSIIHQGVQSLMAVPLQTDERVIGLIYVDSVRALSPFSEEHLSLLTVMANVAAMRIERERFAIIEEAERRHALELEQAAEIQRNHLPGAPPVLAGYDMAAYNAACHTVGGDYYDFLACPDGSQMVVVADVAGKGMPASLLMMSLQARVQVLPEVWNGPASSAARLNRSLAATCPKNRFITLFLCTLEPAGGLNYCNAGHNPPLLLRANGAVEMLETGGPVLGLLPFAPYREQRCVLAPGDVLVLYSDGITEAENKSGAEFDVERLLDVVCRYRQRPSREIIETIRGAVAEWTAGAPRTDDQTMVVIRRT